MKPKARKNRDYLFSIFHKLNLEDAINYVSEVRAQTGDIQYIAQYCHMFGFLNLHLFPLTTKFAILLHTIRVGIVIVMQSIWYLCTVKNKAHEKCSFFM